MCAYVCSVGMYAYVCSESVCLCDYCERVYGVWVFVNIGMCVCVEG